MLFLAIRYFTYALVVHSTFTVRRPNTRKLEHCETISVVSIVTSVCVLWDFPQDVFVESGGVN
jgi:hypothetical protein